MTWERKLETALEKWVEKKLEKALPIERVREITKETVNHQSLQLAARHPTWRTTSIPLQKTGQANHQPGWRIDWGQERSRTEVRTKQRQGSSQARFDPSLGNPDRRQAEPRVAKSLRDLDQGPGVAQEVGPVVGPAHGWKGMIYLLICCLINRTCTSKALGL